MLDKINALLEKIDERIVALRDEMKSAGVKGGIGFVIAGEIDALNWVKEQMEELEI